ncbi:BCNT-domain-containing protein [Thozetella sp. PMI_491]|nr:BCNT-domain-containing protein [Thozetella sp. PMI_491]
MQSDLDHEEEYFSEEDSDFAPEDARGDASASEDESAEGEKAATTKAKRQAGDAEAEDAGFDNSGDEGIIAKGKKRRRKNKDKDGEVAATANGGEDGEGETALIKTRSMRAVEKSERRIAAASGPVTINVDAVWAQMISGEAAPTASQGGNEEATIQPDQGASAVQDLQQDNAEPSEMIRIKRTYNFAGQVHTEEKLVARDSAEAKLYLASLGEDAAVASVDPESSPKRMPRKAFRSIFEPITDQTMQRTDLNLGMTARLQMREQANKENAKKLNTVEKSRMDWAGYVDKEGIKDELELASKSKASYTARQDFLARSEAIREEDAWKARQATRAT